MSHTYSTKSDVTAAEFLTVVLPPPQAKERFELRVKDKTGVVRSEFSRSISGLVKCTEGLLQTHDIWFGPTLRDNSGHGGKANVTRFVVLWADVDDKCFLGRQDDALRAIRSFRLPPSIIVRTGNGYHVYWLLDAPYGRDDMTLASEVMGGIDAELSKNAAVKLDRVSDISRVMRLPNTLNHKDRTPLPVNIEHFDTTIRYSLQDFVELDIYELDLTHVTTGTDGTGNRPGDIFNQKATWAEVFEPNGWTFAYKRNDESYWCRPGKNKSQGISASVNYGGSDLLHVFTSSAPPLEAGHNYSKFAAYTYLNHGGDFKAASADLLSKGYRPEAPGSYLTDLGNAERLIARHGEDLRYCSSKGWLVWDGKRWVDDNSRLMQFAKETIRSIYAEAAVENDDKQRAALGKHANASERKERLMAMVALAQFEPGIAVEPSKLDADPWLLNCQNGVIDLRTGEYLKHERQNLITKIIPVEYDPMARCPLWDAFLSRIMAGNRDLIDFLQRACGYSATGDAGEQVFFLAHGLGANGKSTFLENVGFVLGDYAQSTPFSTFLQKNHDGIPNDLARLPGVRFASAIEADAGRRLSEALVKTITGTDKVSARFLHKEFFDFVPVFKLWLACNHRPVITGTDEAIWRRPLLIPFTVTIPKEERDRNLPEKLRKEAKGILNWIIQGCLAWHHDGGLQAPTEVLAATEEYREESDVLASFIAARCVLDPNRNASAAELYSDYSEEYCFAAGEQPVTSRTFGLRLSERGLQRKKLGPERHWHWVGIGLVSQGARHSPPHDEAKVNP